MGAYSILEGAIDLHVHANPDLYARPFDEIEIAQKARGAGYRGVLFKSHHTTNADRPTSSTSWWAECASLGTSP